MPESEQPRADARRRTARRSRAGASRTRRSSTAARSARWSRPWPPPPRGQAPRSPSVHGAPGFDRTERRQMMAEDVADRDSIAAAATPDEAGGTAPGRGRLAGRRILVVGGGQDDHGLDDPPIGSGRAMSVLFGREGAAVAVADPNGDSAEATARRVRDEGAEATTLVADAADEAASRSSCSP